MSRGWSVRLLPSDRTPPGLEGKREKSEEGKGKSTRKGKEKGSEKAEKAEKGRKGLGKGKGKEERKGVPPSAAKIAPAAGATCLGAMKENLLQISLESLEGI